MPLPAVAIPPGPSVVMDQYQQNMDWADDAQVELIPGGDPYLASPDQFRSVEDEEDLQTRKRGWAEILNEMVADPDTPLMMFSIAATLGQPMRPGENPMARLAAGFAAGETMKKQLRAGRVAEQLAMNKEDREARSFETPEEKHTRALELEDRRADNRTQQQDPGEYEKTRRSITRQVLAEQGLPDTTENRRRVATEVGKRLGSKYDKVPTAKAELLPPTDPRWVDAQLALERDAWDPLINGTYPYEERRQFWEGMKAKATGGTPAPTPAPTGAPVGMRKFNPATGRIE